MTFASEANLNEKVFVIDTKLHKRAKLNRTKFMNRFKSVKYLRTRYYEKYLSFYITSQDEYKNIAKFHRLVNQGKFDIFEGRVIFAIGIEPTLYNWFKKNSLNDIYKQIACWCAGYYFVNEHKRKIIKKQFYPVLFRQVEALVEKYYSNFNVKNIKSDSLESLLKQDQNEVNKCTLKYKETCLDFYNGKPPSFLSSPFYYDGAIEYKLGEVPECKWGLSNHYSFKIIQAYLRDDDWDRIVINKSTDTLFRAESNAEIFENWKHVYEMYPHKKEFIFHYYNVEISDSEDENNSTKNYEGNAEFNSIKTVEAKAEFKVNVDNVILFEIMHKLLERKLITTSQEKLTSFLIDNFNDINIEIIHDHLKDVFKYCIDGKNEKILYSGYKNVIVDAFRKLINGSQKGPTQSEMCEILSKNFKSKKLKLSLKSLEDEMAKNLRPKRNRLIE